MSVGLTTGSRADEPAATSTISSAAAVLFDSSRHLGERYRLFEQSLVAQGALRTDAEAAGIGWDRATLSRNFLEIALFTEYGRGQSGFRASRSAGVLRRWTEPVKIEVMFGASVAADQRQRDLGAISRYADALSRATRHPVGIARGGKANVHLMIVNDRERRILAGRLGKYIPGVSPAVARALANAGPNILCFAAAEPHSDPARGYRSAVILIRAEHPQRMRNSCIEEELAQAMGLPNDADTARPSIFNDDGEFAVLTRHDEALLRMLYDPRLAPGMSLREVQARIEPVAAAAIAARAD